MIRKRLRKYKQWCLKRKAWLVPGLIIALGLPLAFLLSFLLAFQSRVYPRVSICGFSLAGKNYSQAKDSLSSLLEAHQPSTITLKSVEQAFSLNLEPLEYQLPETTEKVLKAGRGQLPLEGAKNLLALLHQGKNLSFDFRVKGIELDSQLASVAASLYQPAVEPEIKVIKNAKQKTIQVETGSDGQEVNLRVLNQKINQALACPQKEISLEIPLIVLTPKISSKTAQQAQARAEALLEKEVILKLDKETWTVTDEEIISFMDFMGGFDKEKITEFAESLAKTINSEPENAAFKFENNRVTVFRPSKEGLELENEGFVDRFEKTLLALENSQESQEMSIPVTKKKADISTADVNSLGIQELLGQGSSLFYGSIPSRIHNLKLASLRLSGILVAPGEEFSFNRSLGDVSTDTGYQQAYIIKEGRTVLGDGGGVCQVSTTLFRAILNAGLPIVERHAHAYRVHYYEDDLGPGFDATVFDPTADLRFQNNTPAYILIQSQINLSKKKLIFEIYGTSDGRKVSLSKARVWDKRPPPPDLYQDDPTLPVGTIKQIDWKSWGAKAAFDYKVTRNDEVLFEKTFYSNYRPWQAVYLRGTGQ